MSNLKRALELFEGFIIINASISSADRISFVTKEDITEEKEKKLGRTPGEDELETDIVLYNPKALEKRNGYAAKGWTVGVREGYVVFSGKAREGQLVFCGVEGSGMMIVSEVPDDDEWFTKKITRTKPFDNHKAMLAATNIDGDVYFAGRLRKLFKRTAKNQWVDMTDENEHESLFVDLKEAKAQGRKPITMPMGFHAIDGFSGNDIYCGGHQGDLWHFDGSQWRRLAPPTNFDIDCIACAGDGNVYVAGAMGGLIRGRFNPDTGEEQWQVIKHNLSGTDARFNSLAWFQDRLYLGHDWALYTLTEEDKVEKVVFPEGGVHQYSFQNVTACSTALLSYGPHQAVVFDGEKWEQIVGGIVIPQ